MPDRKCKCIDGWRITWFIITGLLLVLVGVLIGCCWRDTGWWDKVGNWLAFIFLLVSVIIGVICVERAKFAVLEGRFLRIFRKTSPLTPRKKNIWLTIGAALLTFSFILLLAILYTFVDVSKSALCHFILLITLKQPTCDVVWGSVLTFLTWIAGAAFTGIVVTFIVNLVGIGKKE